MMALGSVLQIVEIIVTVYCGSILAVRPNKMRWEGKAVKGIYYILLLIAILFGLGNVPYAKFSNLLHSIIAIYLFIVLKIFYKIAFWKLCLQNFTYWWGIILIHEVVIFMVCLDLRGIVKEYVNSSEIPWHWLHILIMIVTIVSVILLTYFKRERSLIVCRKRRDYLIGSFFVMIEPVLEVTVLSSKSYTRVVITETVIQVVLYVALLFFIIIIFVILQSYFSARQSEFIAKQNVELFKQQYQIISQMYTEKRKQIHDNVYNNILLLGYLQDGTVDKAISALQQSVNHERRTSKHRYTGITAIDFIVDYKIEGATSSDIQFFMDMDVLYCPVQDWEICTVLGNLMDNAIEATKNLEREDRKIFMSIKTVNNVFLLVIKNQYRGKRKMFDGEYQTTKAEKDMHGLGLGSVKSIIKSYDGLFEVTDDKNIFTVTVSVLKK